MIVFYGTNEAFYWHGATIVSPEYKKLFSVVKLINYVIKDMHSKNIQYLNMGASEGLDGVKRFKESIGAEEYRYSAFKFESKIYKLLKIVKRIIN